MAGETRHMKLDIRGCLMNWSASEMRGMFFHDDGRPMTATEAKAQLLEELAKGRRFLPIGGDCDGFDYQTGCPGHRHEAVPPLGTRGASDE